jgi:hypothetical protein
MIHEIVELGNTVLRMVADPLDDEYRGFPARVLQHEYDHLDGLLYTDRMETNRDLIAEKEYQKRITVRSSENVKMN